MPASCSRGIESVHKDTACITREGMAVGSPPRVSPIVAGAPPVRHDASAPTRRSAAGQARAAAVYEGGSVLDAVAGAAKGRARGGMTGLHETESIAVDIDNQPPPPGGDIYLSCHSRGPHCCASLSRQLCGGGGGVDANLIAFRGRPADAGLVGILKMVRPLLERGVTCVSPVTDVPAPQVGNRGRSAQEGRRRGPRWKELVLVRPAGATLARGDRPAAYPTCASGHQPGSGGPPVAKAPARVPR